MSKHFGGRKRVDKKPGRRTQSWYSARNFNHMASGRVPNSEGRLVDTSQAKLDKNRAFFETVLPIQCAEHTARNKNARERRGTVTGRRPTGLSMEDWIKRITGSRKRAAVEQDPEIEG